MASTVPIKIGIIGGSGLDDPDILEGRTERYVDTPYGKPSDALILGKIKNVECVLLARHGRQHTIMPSNVNYQANIWALREEGCTHLLVTTACGSLREEIQPGDIVIIDQFIDRTTKRAQTLYDGKPTSPSGVCHIPMAEPFCNRTREVLVEVARSLGIKCHVRGTMLTIEGPRFSSRAESLLFRQWGADVINMTTVPEVVLAKEAGLCYASIAMATDYDCWKEHEEAVCVDNVLKTMKENANKASSILLTAIPQISQMDWAHTMKTLKGTKLEETGKRSEERACFIRALEGGHWEPAKHSGLISRSKKQGGKVSAVQSALTDVLYIACHFILQEYWGVAKLKPRRYSNPSPALLPALLGGG